MTLEQIQAAFDKFKTDKGNSHGYSKYYADVFKDFTPASLLEVGVKQGRSIRAWRDLFPKCALTGVDITNREFEQTLIEESNVKIIIADSTKKEYLSKLDSSYDVIIDDGSHYYKDINETFKRLHDRFNHAYIIEDAMYNQDLTIDLIKSMGYNVRVCESNIRNVPVDHCWLETNEYFNGSGHSSEAPKTKVNLYLLIVTKP